MTKLIKKGIAELELYFTLDREISGVVLLELISDFDLKSTTIQLPEPIASNERYTLFSLATTEMDDLLDGLYTYYLTDEKGDLEAGSLKLESLDYPLLPSDQPEEYQSDDDDEFITYGD